jgi:hypothetical protein
MLAAVNAPPSARSFGALALLAAAVCASPGASAEEPPPAATAQPNPPDSPPGPTNSADTKPAEAKPEAKPEGKPEARPAGQPETKSEAKPEPASTPPEPESNTTLPGWLLLGGGLASIATGTGLGLSAGAKKGDLEAACAPDKSCPASQRDELDSARTIANASTVFCVVGGIITIAGVLLLVTPKTPDPWRNTSKTRPFITAGGAGLTGTF